MAETFKLKDHKLPPKLKQVFIIVNREKTDIFLNMLYDFEVNSAHVYMANGSASEEALQKLGVGTAKGLIICSVREDKVDALLDFLEIKFKTVRGGKGIAFSCPIASILSVESYLFLSNQQREV